MLRHVQASSPTAKDAGPVEATRGAASTVEERTADVQLPLLGGERTVRGTVWIPRILWALEWASRHGRSPLSAADIARVLTEHGGIEVSRHNVARAFRDYRNDADVARMWVIVGRGYAITDAGTRTLEALLADGDGA